MLVFISDLHLTDESAFPAYLSPRAVEAFKKWLFAILERRKEREGGGVEEINLVFLGDIFDFIRTDHWWSGVGEEKDNTPWCYKDREGLAQELMGVLRKMGIGSESAARASEMAKAFREMKRDLKDAGLPVKYTYVVGNHDRVVAQFPKVRGAVEEALDIDETIEESVLHFFEGYDVVACHGHEFDPNNRVQGDLAPIGDFIASLSVALPGWIVKKMSEEGFAPEEIQKVEYRLKSLDDVRPCTSLFQWIEPALRMGDRDKDDLMEKLFREITLELVEKLENSAYLSRWLEAKKCKRILLSNLKLGRVFSRLAQHPPFFLPASWVRRVLLSHILPMFLDEGLQPLGRFRRAWDDIANKSHLDRYARAALQEVSRRKVKAVVMGHTHRADQVCLEAGSFYLNTGTWRSFFYQGARSKKQYQPLRRLSAAIVYASKEGGSRLFEFWDAYMGTTEEPQLAR